MKRKLVSDLMAVVTIGTLVGLHANWNHWHWHQLGRQAYLLHEAEYFDKFFVNPASAIYPIATFVVAAFFTFAVFKAFAFVVSKILSKFEGKSVPSES